MSLLVYISGPLRVKSSSKVSEHFINNTINSYIYSTKLNIFSPYHFGIKAGEKLHSCHNCSAFLHFSLKQSAFTQCVRFRLNALGAGKGKLNVIITKCDLNWIDTIKEGRLI